LTIKYSAGVFATYTSDGTSVQLQHACELALRVHCALLMSAPPQSPAAAAAGTLLPLRSSDAVFACLCVPAAASPCAVTRIQTCLVHPLDTHVLARTNRILISVVQDCFPHGKHHGIMCSCTV
jgi:hypothetical protein